MLRMIYNISKDNSKFKKKKKKKKKPKKKTKKTGENHKAFLFHLAKIKERI